jgi:hypothetical protein
VTDELAWYSNVTAALRARSIERARAAFQDLVDGLAAEGWHDWRDTIYVGPYVDCVRRLGGDPVQILGSVLTTAPEWLRPPLDDLVRRSAAASSEFGWTLEETEDGARYRLTR